MSERMEDDRGVHLMWGEHTLCGDAFDGWSSESDWEHGEMRETKRRTVTCPECVRMILECKAARVDKAVASMQR